MIQGSGLQAQPLGQDVMHMMDTEISVVNMSRAYLCLTRNRINRMQYSSLDAAYSEPPRQLSTKTSWKMEHKLDYNTIEAKYREVT